MVPSNVLVFRDSARAHIPVQELVAGDLVYISPGDKVPADLRLIEISSDLQFDRSILTGEVGFDVLYVLLLMNSWFSRVKLCTVVSV